jgi:hypothetical protein
MSLFSSENPALGSQATAGGNIIPNTEPVVFAAQAASQAISQAIFMPDSTGTYQVVSIQAVFGTTSTSGTLQLEQLSGTTAPGSGTVMLTGTMSLSGTANTIVSGTLVSTASTLQIAPGQRLGLKFAGTVTGLVGLVVVVGLKRV